MEYILGQDFNSLTQRILYAYPAAYPAFVPVECNTQLGCTVQAQKEFHVFMEQVLIKLYENPENFDFPIFQDEYYEPYQLANTNPELMKKMEKIENRFVIIITTLIKVGLSGEIVQNKFSLSKSTKAINKTTKSLLELFGIVIEENKENTILSIPGADSIFYAWRAYSLEDNINATKVDRAINFIYAKYFNRVYLVKDFFNSFITDTNAIENLELFYKENDYTCCNYLLNGKTRYACTKWIKEYANGQKSTFSVSFNPRVKDQLKIEFHLPNFRLLLDSEFSSFNEELKRFIFSRLNECHDCGYCTQTDKSGSRQKLARNMEVDGQNKLKCPLYPNFIFNEIESNTIQSMKFLTEKAEKIALSE